MGNFQTCNKKQSTTSMSEKIEELTKQWKEAAKKLKVTQNENAIQLVEAQKAEAKQLKAQQKQAAVSVKAQQFQGAIKLKEHQKNEAEELQQKQMDAIMSLFNLLPAAAATSTVPPQDSEQQPSSTADEEKGESTTAESMTEIEMTNSSEQEGPAAVIYDEPVQIKPAALSVRQNSKPPVAFKPPNLRTAAVIGPSLPVSSPVPPAFIPPAPPLPSPSPRAVAVSSIPPPPPPPPSMIEEPDALLPLTKPTTNKVQYRLKPQTAVQPLTFDEEIKLKVMASAERRKGLDETTMK